MSTMNTQPNHLPVPSVGERYQLRREIDREPYFRARPRLVGTLISCDEHLIRLQMDEAITYEFNNCIEWYDYEPTFPLLKVFREDCELLSGRHLIITISIVPLGALCDDEYDYEQDLESLTQAFCLETQTPQAAVICQDNASGILMLVLPRQQELTPQQYCWQSRRTEITGFECSFSEKVSHVSAG